MFFIIFTAFRNIRVCTVVCPFGLAMQFFVMREKRFRFSTNDFFCIFNTRYTNVR